MNEWMNEFISTGQEMFVRKICETKVSFFVNFSSDGHHRIIQKIIFENDYLAHYMIKLNLLWITL